MTFDAFGNPLWPYLFILIAGSFATDIWRFLGVAFGSRIDPDSEMLVMVRTLATALVAGVIGNQIVFPSGALADVPLLLRIGAAAAGFAAYLALGRRVLLGILVAEAVLLAGILLV
ncbi:MAG: AzlD domain-containing protein [Methylobacterium mesophilicum]|nr:AzlD domain-containing protein [Methylobacterium mesophilicum]